MLSSKKRTAKKAKKNNKLSPPDAAQGELLRIFQQLQSGSPELKMAAAHASLAASSTHDIPPDSPTGSQSPEFLANVLPSRSSGSRTPSQTPLLFGADEELRAILQALPTKADIETLIGKVEAAHRKEIRAVKQEVHSLSDRLTVGEASVSEIDRRVSVLESQHRAQAEAAIGLQLHMEEMEDRSRRNNLRLRGLPEATGPADLADTVADIFRRVAGDQIQGRMEFDRIHRALGPRPRDVICRLHHYAHKDIIARKAWATQDLELDGAALTILPDISRATLQRRALLKPLLEVARGHNATYRWGFPLSVTFRKNQRSFVLRTPDALPALFEFLSAEPIEVPDWLSFIPRSQGRRNNPTMSGGLPPRPPRNRRRSRATSPEDGREA